MTHGVSAYNMSMYSKEERENYMSAQLPTVTHDDWHPSAYERDGGFWTTRMFWDCECNEDYIHSKTQEECDKCNTRADEQPDSRVYEVLNAGLAIDTFMLVEDAIEIVLSLARQAQLDPEDTDNNPALLQQAFRQQVAIDTIEDFFTNVVFGDE